MSNKGKNDTTREYIEMGQIYERFLLQAPREAAGHITS
jgi:hypothetical protein